MYVFDTDHGAYSLEASLSYGMCGGALTRNINIYGQEYSKAQSMTIDASNLRTFYTGDDFDATELVATVRSWKWLHRIHLERAYCLYWLRFSDNGYKDRDG